MLVPHSFLGDSCNEILVPSGQEHNSSIKEITWHIALLPIGHGVDLSNINVDILLKFTTHSENWPLNTNSCCVCGHNLTEIKFLYEIALKYVEKLKFLNLEYTYKQHVNSEVRLDLGDF